MRVGCCGGLEQIEAIQDAGYDYFELPVSAVKAESPDEEFEENAERILAAEIAPESWNCLLPQDMKIVGPEVDSYRVERYLRTAFERIEELGGEVVVFGSGRSRTVPEGFPREEARDQLVEFATLAGQVGGAYGIAIAVEPLNSKACNIINSVREAVELVRAVDHPFVKVLADLQHMMADEEPLSNIDAAAGLLVHAHIPVADLLDSGGGDYSSREFIGRLKGAGYDGRLSVERGWKDFVSDSRRALEFLRGLV